ncbi:MarR family transcriptional regulator, partial [Bacillus paranthracis]|nr:MarR family transcriptional regulator [Bacillus paranthracis]
NLGITEQEYRSLLIQLNKLIETMKTINDRKDLR